MIPFGTAVTATVVTATSYLFFEPRGSQETLGLTLMGLAAFAGALVIMALVRWALVSHATRRVKAIWMREARPLTIPGAAVPAVVVPSTFPIVAVVGSVRPKLVIAQSVIDACSADELQAVLHHEQGHIARHDNLRRALVTAAPDILSWFPIGRRLHSRWHDATEEAADSCVDALGEQGRVLLAQALIRVARLAPTQVPLRDLPTSALYRGENIDRRVRRLLAPPVTVAPPPAVLWRAGVAATAIIAGGLALGAVQALIEAAVTRLP
jgi:Zn-dependent protease with chaperone function